MARVRDGVLPSGVQLGLTLDRYQELMGLDLCAFNGINRPTDNHDNQCIDIVTQTQRDNLATYLLEAEEMREEELGFFVAPKWYTEWLDVGRANPFALTKKHLIEVAFPTETLIEAGVALDFGTPPFTTANEPTDPVVLAVATTVTNASEIVVKYPGEDVDIHPTSVAIAGGIATIRIPRCRLVDPEYNDDWDDPPSYYDVAPFLTTVDVYRRYGDVSKGAEFVWGEADCTTEDCTTVCQPACPVIVGHMAYELSLVRLYPATYNGGWTRTSCFSYPGYPDAARVTYKSGLTAQVRNELNTIRLSHTLMPRAPCQCDIALQKWEEDRKIPEGGEWSAYGNATGAIMVWMFDSRLKHGSGGMFPGIR